MARTIRIKLYKFKELPKAAKQVAIENFRNNADFQYLYDEAYKSVKKFADVFGIDIKNFDFFEPHRNKYRFKEFFDNMDDIINLKGQRLATYIWNNYKNDLYKGKYYSLWSKTEVSYKYNPNGYPVLKTRYSKVILTNCCTLTGAAYDMELLSPVYDFLKKPTDRDLEDLINDCFGSICKTVQAEYRYRLQDEQIAEDIISNEYEFTKDGQQYY